MINYRKLKQLKSLLWIFFEVLSFLIIIRLLHRHAFITLMPFLHSKNHVFLYSSSSKRKIKTHTTHKQTKEKAKYKIKKQNFTAAS